MPSFFGTLALHLDLFLQNYDVFDKATLFATN